MNLDCKSNDERRHKSLKLYREQEREQESVG